MRVLFVCTGNICRSPMGQLMFPLFFYDRSITTDSAGTQGLTNSPIDLSSARLLAGDGIDSSAFRSKRLTPQLALASDLILCFTKHQREQIVALAPRVRNRTFQLNDFAALCDYCRTRHLVHGSDIDERLYSVINAAWLMHADIPSSPDIADPYRKDFPAFEAAHVQIRRDIASIASTLEPSHGAHAQ